MNRKHVSAGSLLAALLVSVGPGLYGQATPAPTPPDVEETVVLSPFVVEAAEDADTYRATATLAGTRIRTDLRDVGSSISVVTQKFLTDTNSTSAESLLVYTTGTEVAGQGGNFLGQGDGAVLTSTNRTSPVQNTRVRGLAEADNTRDFFLSDIPWDSYNVGRVDLQRGPNSILFGIGSPAGIVNSSLNTASFANSAEIKAQFGSSDSTRFVLDVNRVLLPDELALRVALLRDHTNYRQDPAFKNDDRFYGTARWEPKFLATGSARTSVRVNFEKGQIRSNSPRSTPPLDAITPWWNSTLNRDTYDARTVNTEQQGNNWLGAPGQRVWDGVVTAFDGPNPLLSYVAQLQNFPNPGGNIVGSGAGDNVLRGIQSYNQYANRTFAAGAIGAYKAVSLDDRTIFDFRNHLLEGPNKREFNDFKTFNATLAQTFLDSKLGLEIAYDWQRAEWGYENFLSGDASVITIDVMDTLIDGSANPNVGRPMTISGGGSAGFHRQTRTRDSLRFTVFGELNFRDLMDESPLSRALGRHVFTGLVNREERDNFQRSGPRFFLSEGYGAVKRGNGVDPDSLGQASRDNIFYNYLGASAASLSNPSGLGLTGIKHLVQPATSSPIRVWNNESLAWQTIPLVVENNDARIETNKLFKDGLKSNSLVDSKALVWQGYLLDGALVPMVGWRKDEDRFASAGSPTVTRGVANIYNDPSWAVPTSASSLGSRGQWNEIEGTSRTWSIVGHLPRSWSERLPGRMGVSVHYNESENFQPDAGRRDIFGQPVPSPNGETEDYGVTLSFLDDKLSFKVIRYETQVINASVSGSLSTQYLIGAVEAWGQQAAYRFRRSIEPGGPLDWPAAPGGGIPYGIATSGHQVTWRPAGPIAPFEIRNEGGDIVGYNFPQAVLDATSARERASIDAWYATQVPESLQEAWALNDYDTVAGQTNFGFSGLTVTGDTVSKGTEFELNASPVRGLDIVVNASRTTATRMNLAKSYTDWILQRWEEFQGPAGEMRLWGPDDDWSADSAHGGETARGKFSRETMADYRLWQALQDSDVPELRPWRLNLVANYTVQSDGRFHGLNFGGSYRWQDASVTGFPVITDSTGGLVFDVDNPYTGKSESIVDTWVGYQRQLTEKIRWRVQLNVRNLFASDSLIPVTVQPDGSPAAYRIPEPRTWYISNSFTF